MGPHHQRRGVKRAIYELFCAHPDVWFGIAEVKECTRQKIDSTRTFLLNMHADGILDRQVLENPRRVRYKLAQQGETT